MDQGLLEVVRGLWGGGLGHDSDWEVEKGETSPEGHIVVVGPEEWIL